MFDIPKSRITIEYICSTGGTREKRELPLRLLMVGDYTFKGPDPGDVLADRERIRIDRSNFNEVMKKLDISLNFTVPDRLAAEPGKEITVDLKIDDLNSLRPEAVALQVEELSRILEIRSLLLDLGSDVEDASLLDQLLAKIEAAPRSQEEREQMANSARYLLGAVAESSQQRAGRELIDACVAELDRKLSAQLDEIVHHKKFQQLESAWRGLYFLVERTDSQRNVILEILNVPKEELAGDFEKAGDPLKGGLFHHVCTRAYDQYAADPVSLVVANYEFDSKPRDIELLRSIANVGAMTQCPFIASVGPRFFGIGSFDEFAQIQSLDAILDDPAYGDWNSFRESGHSRYIGLTLPKFLLRLPYGEEGNPVKGFGYAEDVKAEDHDKYLWGNLSFALASNITRSFTEYGWTVNIVGSELGGLVENLPLHVYNAGENVQEYRIPVEIKIPDTAEHHFAENGFIPLLLHEAKKVQGCFFSAHSAHKPDKYDDEAAMAKSRLSVRFPYILFISRLMHYLRVIQRDELGRGLSASQAQEGLDKWIKQYVSGPDPRSERLKADRPLQDARVVVQESRDKPRHFDVRLFAIPHYQAAKFSMELSLMAEMPQARAAGPVRSLKN